MGRGRNSRSAQQGPHQGQAPYGSRPASPHTQQQWQQSRTYGGRPADEPEYFGGPEPQGPGQRSDSYANTPGHTQAFTVGDGPGDYGQGGDPYGDHGARTYQAAGQHPAPMAGPPLHWKDLLRGIVFRPGPTFWRMRDHSVWGPALSVTFLYGLVAVFGLDTAREDVLNSTFSSSIPYVLSTGIAVVICGLLLGVVTNTLARQLGGDGLWQPTVGLSMLIMSLTDAPRLIVATFLGGDAPLVQVLGWATWIGAGVLFTSMVSKSHDLPWPKALGASSIQLIALIALMKLGTL